MGQPPCLFHQKFYRNSRGATNHHLDDHANWEYSHMFGPRGLHSITWKFTVKTGGELGDPTILSGDIYIYIYLYIYMLAPPKTDVFESWQWV